MSCNLEMIHVERGVNGGKMQPDGRAIRQPGCSRERKQQDEDTSLPEANEYFTICTNCLRLLHNF